MTDTENSDDSKASGVEFGDLEDELAELSYPVEAEQLLEEHGSEEVEFEEGSSTLGELLEPMGEQSFETKDDVKRSVLTMVDDDAIGRKHYSDRGGSGPDDGSQDESF